MNWSLPDEEATTIVGLVIHEARAIPESGQVFTFHGFRFDVLRKTKNRITLLRIFPAAAEKAALAVRGESGRRRATLGATDARPESALRQGWTMGLRSYGQERAESGTSK
jgi:adenosine/AMP kinase